MYRWGVVALTACGFQVTVATDAPTADSLVVDSELLDGMLVEPDAPEVIPDATPQPACRTAATYNLTFGAQRYRRFTTGLNFGLALASCVAEGASVVKIDNDGENGFVDGQFNGNSWIGASDALLEGTFVWTDGLPVTYERWANNEPNNFQNAEDCAIMNNSGTWNDVPCGDDWGYLCECP
jgi:hypothetical protein